MSGGGPRISVNLSIVPIGLHIAGVLVTSFGHGENLVAATVTGGKRADMTE